MLTKFPLTQNFLLLLWEMTPGSSPHGWFSGTEDSRCAGVQERDWQWLLGRGNPRARSSMCTPWKSSVCGPGHGQAQEVARQHWQGFFQVACVKRPFCLPDGPVRVSPGSLYFVPFLFIYWSFAFVIFSMFYNFQSVFRLWMVNSRGFVWWSSKKC